MMTVVKGVATLLLEHLAQTTWERLEYAGHYGVSQGEETITDINLLDLKRYGADRIRLRKCPKHLESQRGVDWDWVIGNRKLGWRRYAVQAKRIRIPSSSSARYDSLKEMVSTRRNGQVVSREEQLAILRRFAERTRAAPIYCLYNYVDKASYAQYWQCCSQTPDAEQLGCTVTPANVVDWATHTWGKRTFEAIHRKRSTIPWRCLAFCPFITHRRIRNIAVERRPELGQLLSFIDGFRENENTSSDIPPDFAYVFEDEDWPGVFEEVYVEAESYPRWAILTELSEDIEFDDESFREV